MKVGIDIIDIERFKVVNFKSFVEKYLTNNEIEYLLTKQNKYETVAGIFACKEAVLKAFKIGIGNGIALNKIEILHDQGVPFINENQIIKKLMQEFNISKIDISISHSENQAIAICIID